MDIAATLGQLSGAGRRSDSAGTHRLHSFELRLAASARVSVSSCRQSLSCALGRVAAKRGKGRLGAGELGRDGGLIGTHDKRLLQQICSNMLLPAKGDEGGRE